MEQKNVKRIKTGLVIGGVASVAYLFANKNTRTKIVGSAKGTATAVRDAGKFISENRDEILEQLQVTSDHISNVLKAAGEDVQKITESVCHLRTVTGELVETTKEATEELKQLGSTEKEEDSL